MSRLTQYEEAKKHLFMRVSNIEENLQVLDNVPYVERADLAITFILLSRKMKREELPLLLQTT